MKKIISIVIVSILAASSYSQGIQRGGFIRSIKQTPEERIGADKKYEERKTQVLEEISKMPMSSVSLQTSWKRGIDTNDVTVTVYVGGVHKGPGTGFHLFRNLTFDKDGRLVSVSPAIRGKTNAYVANENPSCVRLDD